LKFSVALRDPVVVGAKTMFAVQLAEAASEDPQVLLNTLKSPGFAPVNVMLEMVIAEAFPLVSVTTFWPPVLPTATETQLRLVGETETAARQLIAGTMQGVMMAFPAKLNCLSVDAREFVARSALKSSWRFVNPATEARPNPEHMHMAPPGNFTVLV